MGLVWKIRSVLWRVKVRRLYNSSHYEQAEALALRRVTDISDGKFAKDIIIRSLYNREKWVEVEDFYQKYPHENIAQYSKKARLKRISNPNHKDMEPSRFQNKEWDEENLLSNWHQEENILWLRYPNGWVYWEMPIEFNLKRTHGGLLYLAMEVLLSPWIEEVRHWDAEVRARGINSALAYSGGIDSTAAALLLPDDALLAYHKRSFDSVLTHDLAMNSINTWNDRFMQDVLVVPSNHERIRSSYGKQIGFSTDLAAGVHLILLSDALNLSSISFGTPIDNTWLAKGRKFRDFSQSKYWKKWKTRFNSVGLDLEFPINHISEAGAMKICERSGIIDKINSCLRGNGGVACMACWKCFIKNGPLGRDIIFESKEIQKFLTSTPLRTAQHTLWAIQKQKLESKVPHLSKFLSEPLEWWEDYYPPGLNLISDGLRPNIETQTRKYLQPMTNPIPLESVDIKL
jgi:hypothetical protein